MTEFNFFIEAFNKKLQEHNKKQFSIPTTQKVKEMLKPFKNFKVDSLLLKSVNEDIETYLRCHNLSAMWDSYRKYLLNIHKNYNLTDDISFTQEKVQHTYKYYLHSTIEGLKHLTMLYDSWGAKYFPENMHFYEFWFLLEKMETHLYTKYKLNASKVK